MIYLGGIVLLLSASIASERAAWVILVAAAFSSGLSLTVGPVHLFTETLALPLLFVIATKARSYYRPHTSIGGVQVLALTSWVILTLASSSLNAIEPWRSLYVSALYASGVLAYLLLAGASTARKVLWLRSSSVVLAIIAAVSIAGWVVAQTGGPVWRVVVLNFGDEVFRLQGLMLEPNLMAFACFSWLALLYYHRAAFSPKFYISAGTPIALALTLTFTRTAFAALALLAIFAFARKRRVSSGWVLVLVSAIFVTTLSFFGSANRALNSLLSQRYDDYLNFVDGTGGYRLRIWSMALEQLSAPADWLLGFGANSFSQRNLAQDTSTGEAYLGNFWLSILYDSGALGAVLASAGLFMLWLQVRRKTDALPLLFGAGLATTFTSPMWFLFPWIALALLEQIGVNHDAIEDSTGTEYYAGAVAQMNGGDVEKAVVPEVMERVDSAGRI